MKVFNIVAGKKETISKMQITNLYNIGPETLQYATKTFYEGAEFTDEIVLKCRRDDEIENEIVEVLLQKAKVNPESHEKIFAIYVGSYVTDEKFTTYTLVLERTKVTKRVEARFYTRNFNLYSE